MIIKYFKDTDTLLLIFSHKEIKETKDVDENTLLELDEKGDLVSMTIEHAQSRININELTFEQIPAENVQ
jgi:uncharacterized protein YuzE